MLIISALAILSFVAGVWSVTQGEMANAAIQFIFAGLTGGFAYFLSTSSQNTNAFLTFVAQNKEKLATGETLYYEGTPISNRTEVTRFYYAVSIVILSTKTPTSLYVRGRDNTVVPGLLCSLVSLLMGWWGFPWGPIYTIQALYLNARGGKMETIGQLLPQLELVPVTPAPASNQPVPSISSPTPINSTHSTKQSPWS